MSYSDLGVLLPTESQYGNPQAYTESIRAESNKQATYLSNMDQFYTQLDESKRQFEAQYAARTKEFEWTASFNEKQLAESSRLQEAKLAEQKRQFEASQKAIGEQFSWTSAFQEKQLAQKSLVENKSLELQEKESALKQQLAQKQLEFQETEMGFKKEQLGFESQKLQAELESLRTNTGIAQQQMALQEKLGMSQIGSKAQELALQRELGLGQLQLGEMQLGAQTKSNQFGQQLQYAQFMAGLDQAFPQGIQTGYSQTKAQMGKNPYEMSPATEVYGKMLQKPGAIQDTYTPNYTTSAQARLNQARGIYY